MNFDLDALRSFAEQVKEEDVASEKGFVLKVVGVSFENRQALINVMTKKTEVRFVRDRTNEFDFYATSVEAKIGGKWFDVGFIPKGISQKIAEKIDKNLSVSAKILHFNEFFCREEKITARGITLVLEGV